MLYCIEPLIRYTEEGTKNLLERWDLCYLNKPRKVLAMAS